MLSRLRNQVGTAGLVVAIVALVAALAGGAIAATGGSSDGKASASAAGKKGPRGPKGPKGAPGPAGPQGPVGPQGPKGDAGSAGANGADGADGTDGEPGPTGPTGKAGKEGSPWTAGGTLPEGATETGAWGFGEGGPAGATVENAGFSYLPISFPIALADQLPPANVHFLDESGNEIPSGNPSTDCLGTVAEPTAANGHLCVYTGYLLNAQIGVSGGLFPVQRVDGSFEPGANTAGAFLVFREVGATGGTAAGTWAVSGATE